MMAQALRSGAETRYLGIVEDDEAALNAVISRGLDECDVVLLSGGVSAGIYDLVQGAMRDCGVEIYFDRIRMKPGKPLTFGALGKKLVFGLPGNPVSAVVGLELLVRPAVRKMQSMSEVHRPMVRGKLAQGFRQSPGRKQFVPARSDEVNGCWESRWVGHHGSADLFSLSRANSLFVVEAEVEALNAGAEVDIVLLEEW
jgi:molybdopterin molybdotransferase